MIINSINKCSLIDYPGKISCIVFLQGCNFHCGYCYNPETIELDTEKYITKIDFLKFLSDRKNKLDGVVLSGGEPLLTLEEDFVNEIKKMGYDIKIDTNGSFPNKIKSLIENDLVNYIAMDIKGAKEDYNQIAEREVNLDDIENSIKLIAELDNYEFRTTFVERYHDVQKILKTVNWVYGLIGKKIKKFTINGFKNFGKFNNDSFHEEPVVTEEKIKKIRKAVLLSGLVSEI